MRRPNTGPEGLCLIPGDKIPDPQHPHRARYGNCYPSNLGRKTVRTGFPEPAASQSSSVSKLQGLRLPQKVRWGANKKTLEEREVREGERRRMKMRRSRKDVKE